ncbi:MAG: 50S ribosomal protein L35 [Candidatus Eisenbacteria bacterium]|nr:50S ribosomal protein L35 [Candidatus Eisenbacteria bacterium]
MPKMKTRRGAAKRFKITGSGRIMRRKAFRSHLQTGKKRKVKRRLRRPAIVDKTNERHLRAILGPGR